MVELRPIGTRFEVADFGTKALPEPAFVMLCYVLLGLTTFSELRGMYVVCCSSLDEEDGGMGERMSSI